MAVVDLTIEKQGSQLQNKMIYANQSALRSPTTELTDKSIQIKSRDAPTKDLVPILNHTNLPSPKTETPLLLCPRNAFVMVPQTEIQLPVQPNQRVQQMRQSIQEGLSKTMLLQSNGKERKSEMIGQVR